MDAVFAEAERTDQMIIPVLSAQDGACESEKFKDRSWYVGGWKTDDENSTRLSFEDWVQTAVNRWKDSPSVAAWELVGEPDPGDCVNGNCDWWVRTCPTDAAQVLRDFMEGRAPRSRRSRRSTWSPRPDRRRPVRYRRRRLPVRHRIRQRRLRAVPRLRRRRHPAAG
ncbi:hypothetical protein GS444_13320 [Rhodococcus hoagii]|nr:hypothetical protein [Prescottella equi]